MTLATIDAQAMEWQHAPDDRRVLDAERADGIAVHEHVIRRDAKPPQGAAHGEHGGVVDVDAVDLPHRRGPHGHAERTFPDARRHALTLGPGELLGVVDAADGAHVGGHDHGACDDGAREGAPSDFVDPGEKRPP